MTVRFLGCHGGAQAAWSMLLLVGCLLVMSGCAARVPGSSALPPERRQEIMLAWQQLLARQCPNTVEADLALRWDSLTERGAVSARLLMRGRACKVSVVTPLGQPLLIFSTDGAWYRLARVQDGRGFEGSTASQAWRRFLPTEFSQADLGSWLTGRPDPLRPVDEVRRDEASGHAWIMYHGPAGRERFLFDAERGLVLRRLLTDGNEGVQLAMNYAGHEAVNGCHWPREIRALGGGFGTELSLRVKQWWFPAQVDDAALGFAFPPGYTVEQLP